MGTRSLIRVYDEQSQPIIDIYHQYDGYLSTRGAHLFNFLDGKPILNGYLQGAKGFNGMPCLAASLISYFKTEIGNCYVYSPYTFEIGDQDYSYLVYFDGYNKSVKVEVYVGDYLLGKDLTPGYDTLAKLIEHEKNIT